MMKQSDAVVLAVRDVFPNHEVIPPTTSWSESQKDAVTEMMMKLYRAGEWLKSSGGTDEASVLKYIPGLVNNHVRKDKRLNGGTEYVPKNPGSRTGSADESVQAMRQLLALCTDPDARAEIKAALDARIAELKPKQEIKVDALPESLRRFVK